MVIHIKKEVIPLRKKSHILLTKYLAEQVLVQTGACEHRISFCYGSIVPDLRPSFLVKKHEFFGTYGELVEKMQLLTADESALLSERQYWKRLGEVLHYVADYFTFPHNVNYPGGFSDHNRYEKVLKNTLKQTLKDGDVIVYSHQDITFESIYELAEFIEICHDSYMRKQRSVEEDIQYITMISIIVSQGIVMLRRPAISTFPWAVAGC